MAKSQNQQSQNCPYFIIPHHPTTKSLIDWQIYLKIVIKNTPKLFFQLVNFNYFTHLGIFENSIDSNTHMKRVYGI